jgi:hypothetical protein
VASAKSTDWMVGPYAGADLTRGTWRIEQLPDE